MQSAIILRARAGWHPDGAHEAVIAFLRMIRLRLVRLGENAITLTAEKIAAAVRRVLGE